MEVTCVILGALSGSRYTPPHTIQSYATTQTWLGEYEAAVYLYEEFHAMSEEDQGELAHNHDLSYGLLLRLTGRLQDAIAHFNTQIQRIDENIKRVQRDKTGTCAYSAFCAFAGPSLVCSQQRVLPPRL